MKNPSKSLGYSATLSLAIYGVIKFLHLEGAIIMMFITGILIAIYFSWLFLKYFQKQSGKQIHLVHITGVVIFCIFIIATLLRFNHFWQISTWMLEIVFAGFSFIFIPWLIFTNFKENKNDLWKNLMAGLGLSIISISLFGFLMHWPLHEKLFIIGNIIFFLIYLPWHIFPHHKKQISFDFMFQTLIIVYILVLFVFGIFLKWPVTHLI